MSNSIDERVVAMRFDNAQFQQGVQQTTTSLDQLNKSLKMEGSTKGLQDLDAAGKKVDLNHIATAVDDISNRFKAMSAVAISTLATITSKAVTAGLQLVKSLTVAPVSAGLSEYQTNINAIQTILSNTRWQHTGLDDVNAALDQLNTYSDQTIYNFTEMARNIGTFTAAGVKLNVATAAIKGIANLAAVSGSSSEQASVAMYQLSQAIATGTVKLIDWNSVVNAGLGGKVFQDALLQTARNHHIAVDSMIKDAGSFRATLEKGWLSSQILTETLDHFTGDLSEKQLRSAGYTAEQAKSIVAMGLDAKAAATKVKTISQLLSTLQESAGSGWTKTWSIIFGNFEEARTLFTDVNNTLGAFIQTSADARNDTLQDWKDLGGRAKLIQAISLAFNDLLEILYPIRLAFRDVFPKTTGKQLYDLTSAIERFFSDIRLNEKTMDNLRRTFAGLFAIFGIGWDIIKGLAGVVFQLFEEFTNGNGSFLDFTANIGDFLVELRKAIQDGHAFATIFQFLSRVLTVPIQLLHKLADALDSVFQDVDTSATADNVVGFVTSLHPLEGLGKILIGVWDKVAHIFDNIWHVMEPLADAFSKWFHTISDAVGGLHFEDLLHAINTGVFAAFVLVLKDAFGKNGASGVISELTNTLGAMQHTLQAATLLEIATAIGILTISVSALSKVDAHALSNALKAISVMFVQLIAAIGVLQKLPGGGIVRLYATAVSMVVLATAIDVLAIAVKQLSKIDAPALHKGLIGVMILIGSLVAAIRLIPPTSGLISTGVGLLILSAGIKVLASAVTDLSGLSWEQLAKGLSAVGGLLASLALFTRLASVNATGIFTGAGIVLLATGIKILASAMDDLSAMSWQEIGKGLTVLAGSLVAIGTALTLIPPSSVISAAGVLVTATSLGLLADALKEMGGFSWIEIGKGMTVLAGALTAIGLAISLIPPTAPISAAGVAITALAISSLADSLDQMGGMNWSAIGKGLTALAGALGLIAITLSLMTGALPGAAALLVVSGALVILSGVLLVLGKTDWSEIWTGIGALALAFTTLGVAGLLLAPVVPVLIGLGAAIALLGAGLAAVGAGVFLFSAGLTALSVAGAAGAAALVAIFSGLIGLIPTFIKQVGVGVLAFIDVLKTGVPEIVGILIDVLMQLLQGIDKIAPQLFETLGHLLTLLLGLLISSAPKMVEAGIQLILALLRGLRDHIGDIVGVVTQLIVRFLRALGDNLPTLVQAGIDFLIKFINALGQAVNNNGTKIGKAVVDLGINIIKGVIKGLWGMVSEIGSALLDILKSAWNGLLDFFGISSPAKKGIEAGQFIMQGIAVGLSNYASATAQAAADGGDDIVSALHDSLSAISDISLAEMDLTPTITPVLDLTNVKRDSDQISSMLNSKPIDVNPSYSSARQAADGYNSNKTATDAIAAEPVGDIYNFTQNNTSPKALSNAEIYRLTKNQLSVVKGGLPN